MREVWISVGRVTDVDRYDGKAVLGQPEYQFSDGPAESRSMSADYIDLEKGLREQSGCVIYWED